MSETSKVRTIQYNSRPLRRSRIHGNLNLQDSFGCFIQANRQSRYELQPWLLKDRRVSHATGHHRQCSTYSTPSRCTGWDLDGMDRGCSPKACEIPLPLTDVDAFGLLKHSHIEPDFQINVPAQCPHANQRGVTESIYLSTEPQKQIWRIPLQDQERQQHQIASFIQTSLNRSFNFSRSNVRPSLEHAAMVKLDIRQTYAALVPRLAARL